MAAEIAERDEPQRKKTNPVKFFQEVRAEARKVHWATRNETMISTIMVLIMVTVAAIFFFLADQILSFLVRLILGLGQ